MTEVHAYHIEYRICSADQWTGFYMIRTSLRKKLIEHQELYKGFIGMRFARQYYLSLKCSKI